MQFALCHVANTCGAINNSPTQLPYQQFDLIKQRRYNVYNVKLLELNEMNETKRLATIGQVRLWEKCHEIEHGNLSEFIGISTTELAKALALSVPTVAKMLWELEEMGFVECKETEHRPNAVRYGWMLTIEGERLFRKMRTQSGYQRALDWIISNHTRKAKRDAMKILGNFGDMFDG